MSPLEIEAYRGIALKATGRKLEPNQLKMIDKDGKEFPVFPGESGFTLLVRGQKLIIPDVPGLVKVETHGPSFTLFKDSNPRRRLDPRGDEVYFLFEAEGWGVTKGEETPSINKQERKTAKSLEEQPYEVWWEGRKRIKVSWREGGER